MSGLSPFSIVGKFIGRISPGEALRPSIMGKSPLSLPLSNLLVYVGVYNLGTLLGLGGGLND